MPDPALYAGFVAATLLLMLMPGPNVALIVGNSVAFGTRMGLATVAGTASAMVPQLALTGWGMASLLNASGAGFAVLRWLGVAYLIGLGLRQFLAPAAQHARLPARPLALTLWARGFFVSLTNPKTLLFYAAFFPQFVSRRAPAGLQLLVLAMTFLTLAVVIDSLWAIAAGRTRRWLAGHSRWHNRISGGVLMGAGLALALARRGG